jgi:glycosyltransferase involved in cell wall biosynthesis
MTDQRGPDGQRPRVVLLENIVAPYRVCVYSAIGERVDLLVLVSGTESNRPMWDQTASRPTFQVRKSLGFTIRRRKGGGEGVFDYQHIHITPGILWDLWRAKPRVVISSEMGFRTLAAMLYCKLSKVPLWIWWGGTMHTERYVGKARRWIRRFIVKRCKHWISYGATSTEYLQSLGVPRDEILQIQNCVDETKYRSAVPPVVSLQPKPVILHVGQLILRKGIDQLFESAARLQGEGYEFSLLLVGQGPERERLERRAEELGLNHVCFYGGARAEQMPAIYRSADCLVFPTLEDVWGLVANEALWSGVPVLVSKFVGCAPEIVPPANIFDPTDPEDFDRALRLAVSGKLSPADTSSLLEHRAVAKMITDDIERVLAR